MKEKLAVTVLVTTLALFGLVVVLYRMIKDKDDSFASTIASYRASVNEAIKESIELFK